MDYLKKHARAARPNLVDKPTDGSFLVLEGMKEEVLEKLKEIPVSNRVIAILFDNAESYCTQGPVVRRIVNQLPKIVGRIMHRDQLLVARLFFAFTANGQLDFQS